MKILFVHSRKGLFRLTKCGHCGHVFGCENCDANLITYRQFSHKLELICHQCQSYYDYPASCPNCRSQKIISSIGGIEQLQEQLEKEFEVKITRLDNESSSKKLTQIESLDLEESSSEVRIFLTTRIFDPSLDYASFDKIVFVQAENLLASPDYLVAEETMKQLAEIMLQISAGSKTQLVMDTNSPDTDFFESLSRLNQDHPTPISISQWYDEFSEQEAKNRNKFKFPPFHNLLLLTSQQKNKDTALQNVQAVESYFIKHVNEFNNVSIGSPYPARFLKRKNMYSYHLLLRFPRQYEQFSHLRKVVTDLADLYKLQIRLNPRHLF
jgi:primosomal protein N' (replication factor Y) (superfamily II helicase)